MAGQIDKTNLAFALAAAFVCAAPLGAQTLDDPMRPPGAAATGAVTAATQNGLQGTLTSPQRKLAVIDGAVVRLGQPVRGAKLEGLSDSLAVLQKDGERDVLLMHPNIEKKRARREAGQ